MYGFAAIVCSRMDSGITFAEQSEAVKVGGLTIGIHRGNLVHEHTQMFAYQFQGANTGGMRCSLALLLGLTLQPVQYPLSIELDPG